MRPSARSYPGAGRPQIRPSARRTSIEPAANIFNLFNTPANTQWNVGANQTYSPNYLARFNRHPPRSLQLSVAFKF